MVDGEDRSLRFFHGLQPRWLSWDRLFRIHVSDQMVAGAYLAGQLYDERLAALQLQQLRWFLRPLVRRRLAQRREREALYELLDPFEPSLLEHDPRNFQIRRSEVARTRFRRNRSRWTPFNVGVVEFELLDGPTRRLILVGDQEPDGVLKLVQQFDPAVEVTGKPNPLPRPKPMSPAGKRFYFGMFAVLLLGFGAVFGLTAWAGVAPNPIHWPLAVAHLLLGGWCVVLAWRVPGNEANPGDGGRTGRNRR